MIRKLLGLEKDVERCNALVDGEVCGREAFGWNGPKSKRYCRKHAPADASPWIVRFEPIEFADDEDTLD